jgi:hypothetical protein
MTDNKDWREKLREDLNEIRDAPTTMLWAIAGSIILGAKKALAELGTKETEIDKLKASLVDAAQCYDDKCAELGAADGEISQLRAENAVLLRLLRGVANPDDKPRMMYEIAEAFEEAEEYLRKRGR